MLLLEFPNIKHELFLENTQGQRLSATPETPPRFDRNASRCDPVELPAKLPYFGFFSNIVSANCVIFVNHVIFSLICSFLHLFAF